MSTKPTPKNKHYTVAIAIANMPSPRKDWPKDAACNGAEYGAGLESGENTEGTALKREMDRYFIGRFCAGCAVPKECFVEGVQLLDADAVRGGQTVLEMGKYVEAYEQVLNERAQGI